MRATAVLVILVVPMVGALYAGEATVKAALGMAAKFVIAPVTPGGGGRTGKAVRMGGTGIVGRRIDTAKGPGDVFGSLSGTEKGGGAFAIFWGRRHDSR
jgi:hypothetical protein